MIGDNMAECNVSIDQDKLPGVKEVCRDFAVLEDHCLAYNLQEQEIESHLASNVHKSRLVQKDLQVAKKLQEEEDQRAKIHIRKQRDDIERQDTEIAQEIQDRLVRQAEQQRKQEEKDAAIARKLHEREMKDERRRQKQLEANFEEEYFEDHGAKRRPLDLDRDTRHTTPTSHHREYSPNYNSIEAKRSRHPKQDPASPHGRSKYPENYLPNPDNLHHSRNRHGDRYPEYEPTEFGRARSPRGGEDEDSVVKRRERPARPPPPAQIATERGRDTHRDRDRGRDREGESHTGKDHRREGEAGRGRYRERPPEKALSQDRLQERDRQRRKDRQRARTRSSERDIEDDYLELGPRKTGLKVGTSSWDGGEDDGEREKSARGRQRVHSGPDEVFDEHRSSKGRADTRDHLHPGQEEGPARQSSHSYSTEETGHIVHKASGALVAETESKLSETTKGMMKLDLREQELKDMEVARKLQEEEMKASKMMEVRAAQVAQDEEIARLMMEQEKKEYRKNREREKEKERERMAMDRRWQEGDNRPNPEEVVRPRTREEAEYYRQKNQVKPARPPQPRTHDYENVSSVYSYPDQPAPARPPARPEAAYKGAYYKR